ncbi:MAG: hypothetical protein M4D80_40500 [Myxococcota bacterium]|nr:hypothetical protein [Myxococcota bacterium]
MMHFVFRADGVFRGQDDVYVVVADRGDAPPIARRFTALGGAFVFQPPTDEVIELIDEGAGFDTVRANTTSSLCTCDPALIEAGVAPGVPTLSVIRTAVASILSAVWGHQAVVVADPTVLLRLVEACTRVAKLGRREPLFVAFQGSSNNPAFAPCSALLYAPLPSGEPSWILVLDAQDLDEVVDVIADGREEELIYVDAMRIALRGTPAFASRMFEAMFGCAAVPIVRRTHLDKPCLLSEEDLLTLAAALELYANPREVASVASTDRRIYARIVDPSLAMLAAHDDNDRSGTRSL